MARGGLQLMKNIRDCRKYIKYLLENKWKLGFNNDDAEQVQWWMEVADNIHADLTYDESTLEAVYQGILDLSVAHPMPGDHGCIGGDGGDEDPWSSGSNAACEDEPEPSNKEETQNRQGRLWNPLFQEKQEDPAGNLGGVPAGRGRGRLFPGTFAEPSWRPSQLNPSGNQNGTDTKPPLGRGRGRHSASTVSIHKPYLSTPPANDQNAVGRSATISPPGPSRTPPGNITSTEHLATHGNGRSSYDLDPSLNVLRGIKESTLPPKHDIELAEVVGTFRDPRLGSSRRDCNGSRSDQCDDRIYASTCSQAPSAASFSNYNGSVTRSGMENRELSESHVTSSLYTGQPSNFSRPFPGNSQQCTNPPFPTSRLHTVGPSFPNDRLHRVAQSLLTARQQIVDPHVPNGQYHIMEPPSYFDDQPGGESYMNFDPESSSGHSSHPLSSTSASLGNRKQFVGPPFPNSSQQTVDTSLSNGRRQREDPPFSNGHQHIADPPSFLDDQPGGMSYTSFDTDPNQYNFCQRPRGPQHIRPHQPASIKNGTPNFRNFNNRRSLNGTSSPHKSHLHRKFSSPTRSSRLLGIRENTVRNSHNSHKNQKEGDKITQVNTLREEVENAAASIRQKIRMNLKDIRQEIPTALYRLGTKDKNNRVKVPVEEIAAKPCLGEASTKKASGTKKTAASSQKVTTKTRGTVKKVRFENDDASSESSSPLKSILKVKLPFSTKNSAKETATSKQKSDLQRKGPNLKSPSRAATTKAKGKQNLQSKPPPAKKGVPRVVYSSDEDDLTPQRPLVPELTINMDSHTYETEKLMPFLSASAVVMRIMDTKENAETCLRNPTKFRDYVQELEQSFKDFDQELICPGGFSMPEEEEEVPTPSHGGRALRPRGIPKQLKLTPAVIVFLQSLYGEYLEMVGTKASSASTEPGGGSSKQTLKRKRQDTKTTKNQQSSNSVKAKKSSQPGQAATSSYSIPANIFTGPGLDSIPTATIITDSAFKAVGAEIIKPAGEEMEESSAWENNPSFIKAEVKMETDVDGFELPPEVLENLNIEPDSR